MPLVNDLPPSRAQAHVSLDTDETTPMLPDIPKTTRPDTMAVVALADPVVLRIMVTSGLDEFRRRSTEGIQICCRSRQHKLLTAGPGGHNQC